MPQAGLSYHLNTLFSYLMPHFGRPHYYPINLAAALRERWPAGVSLPTQADLQHFISVAYQASLLYEEGQPVRFRLLLASGAQRPSMDLEASPYILTLAVPRPYEEQEIRRLSPALHAPGSLLAVRPDADEGLVIWAVLRRQQPPRVEEAPWPVAGTPVPQVLLLDVRGPGNLVFYCGSQRVLTLQHGHIEGHGFVDYPVAWSRGRFAENVEMLRQYLGPEVVASTPELHPLAGQLSHYIVRRIVTRVRASGHGGLLALVPSALLPHCIGPQATLRPKYPVSQPAGPPPYLRLLLAIVARLTELGDISWLRYLQADDARLLELAGAIDQYADLLADLMTVDGALVISKQLVVAGFGVEVYAPQLALTHVYRALDADAAELRAESPDHGGTRHRAAYRLCAAEPESMAIVVSQDGGVRFVHAQEGKVVFWEQLTL
jgi:hypothetical protein